ncbi:LutB/LldF family L-lactate oxidation iron-sulfur protein [Paenibacillus radicis (ex Gao et al. 2016)]|uniref:Iron-sulfur cluster-binding protein n=1 Tax=Paenibacillus radicis (ex Gao et al. 2016) TaxID=1737354 RepID=A0A917HTC8_9BACL|nr:LutB/LldF family L-lactate oxidation iron-sulfur protein [Paenibacillus radicis (ex Gao et al. 2016)]GGG89383.1 iron-sulfur cluster-binding protein [Paenibacillus radicis (ex Gao et al. 2016)]
MSTTSTGVPSTVKKRADLALNDEFLRKAVKFTTERLRNGKINAAEEHGNWEEWRERGRQIRLHTIAHLDYYLNLFADNARANGVHVHFASTSAEAVKLSLEIAQRKQAKSVVKSKSMVTEELHLNHELEGIGVEAIETDLGEYIIQLAGETPSHIIIPAIHKNRYQIADLLSKEAGETLEPDTSILAGFVRKKLREKFLEADIGMTGCNFAIAETGSMVLFENEGNARMVTTVPKTQITLMGMERIIPSWSDLEVMATLLPRSATGQKLTVYMSGITGPRREVDADGPDEMHIIIVDNGRSLQLGDSEFQELLNCIRCGACLNACPVYRHIGGHAYGGTYSGPIGAVLTPALQKNIAEWDDIANASSLCGACYEACPVKIPLHEMLIYLRRRKQEGGHGDAVESAGMKGFAAVLGDAKRFRGILRLGKLGQKLVVRNGEIRTKFGPLKGWNSYRVTPSLPKRSFREQWGTLEEELRHGLREMDPAMQNRMEAIARERKNGTGGGHGHHG